MDRTFTCQVCRRSWPEEDGDEEEAQEEMRRLYGPDANSDTMAVVCDECYAKFMNWWRTIN